MDFDSNIKSLPHKAREIFKAVASRFLQENPGEEASAVRMGWNAIEKAGYKKDGHKWVEDRSAVSKMFKPFTVNMSFIKADRGEDGKLFLTVKASGPKVDRQDERMSDNAIGKMIAKAKASGIELLDNHYASFAMGKSVDGWLNDAGEVLFKFEGNKKNPYLPMLFDEVEKGTCDKHTSVGGAVLDAEWEYDNSLGKAVRVLKDVDIDHLAITRHEKSAYPFEDQSSFVGAILKQLDLPNPAEKGGDSVKKSEILALLKQAAEGATALIKALSASVTLDMFEKTEAGMTLKKEFEGNLLTAEELTKEEKAEFSTSMEAICKGLGIPLTKASVKEETEAEKSAKAEADAKKKTPVESSTQGSGKPHEGNGSAAEKAVVDVMLKTTNEELKKAKDELEALKKDQTTKSEELLKQTLMVSELVKRVAVLEKTPLNARPEEGQGQPVQKDAEGRDLRPSDQISKDATGADAAISFAKGIEAEADGLVKMKGTRSWTPEVAQKAQRVGEVLKTIKSVGVVEAYKQFGPKK